MEPIDASTLDRPARAEARPTELSIVIVSFNCRQLIVDCLRSIYESTRNLDFEVIVVDNASVDGSAEAIAAAFPQIRIVCLNRNLGFGRGCNAGAERANGRFILLLNPDTLVCPGAIETLMRFAESHPGAGIWGGQTLSPYGDAPPVSFWRFPTVWSTFCAASSLSRAFPKSALFNREAYGGVRRTGVRRADVVSGCLLLIRKNLWTALGGFDPTYFMYSEEVDLCLRARDLGARPLVSFDVEVMHYVGRTQNVRSDRMILLLTGKRTFMLQHWSRPRRWAGTLMLLWWPLSRYLALTFAGHALGRRSAKDGAATWGEVWRRRRQWLAGYPPARP